MTLTNRANLPEPFVVAFGIDDYERGDAALTTTEMPLPPRILSYRKKYWDDMVEDVSDRVWAFAGQTKHIVLERIARSNPERYIAEQRFETIMPGGKKVSGKIDLYDKETRIQYDWKETSVWKFILGDMEEWTAQGNVNRYLMQQNNINPVQLINVAWLKDWKKRLARTTKRDDYPQCAINVIELPMWSVGETQAYILERLKIHAEQADDPPVCSKKERWQRDHVYAVMKKGRKSALKLCDNKDMAEAIMESQVRMANPGEKFYIEERPTEPVRCLDWCPVQKFCDFGIESVKKWRSDNEQQA